MAGRANEEEKAGAQACNVHVHERACVGIRIYNDSSKRTQDYNDQPNEVQDQYHLRPMLQHIQHNCNKRRYPYEDIGKAWTKLNFKDKDPVLVYILDGKLPGGGAGKVSTKKGAGESGSMELLRVLKGPNEASPRVRGDGGHRGGKKYAPKQGLQSSASHSLSSRRKQSGAASSAGDGIKKRETSKGLHRSSKGGSEGCGTKRRPARLSEVMRILKDFTGAPSSALVPTHACVHVTMRACRVCRGDLPPVLEPSTIEWSTRAEGCDSHAWGSSGSGAATRGVCETRGHRVGQTARV